MAIHVFTWCHVPVRIHARVSAGDRRYVGEPVFVPRPEASRKSEDDGYVVVNVHDLSHPERDTCCIEILDGLDLQSGPVCTIALQDLVPPGLHGSWSARVARVGDDESLPTSGDVRYDL
jgi:carotenoid cleavage dioxygenase-like enzyme